MAIRSRIAPTPSGYLHLGNVLNFLLTRLETNRLNGKMLLRIDDADSERVRDEYINDIFYVLHELGIAYEEGPRNLDDFKLHYSQTLRKRLYDEVLNKLAETGLLFACNCSRSEVLKNPNHTHCKHQSIRQYDEGFAWRLNTEEAGVITFYDEWLNEQRVDIHAHTPYPVMRKKDGFAAYTICSLADDIKNEINLIVRGEDLLQQTALQCYVAKCCGFESFLGTRFYHHKLLRDEQGNKLSKSAGSNKHSLLHGHQSRQWVYEVLSRHLHFCATAIDFSSFEQLYLQHGLNGSTTF